MLARERREARVGAHNILKIAVELVSEPRNIRGFFHANFWLRERRGNDKRCCKQRNDRTRRHKTNSRKLDSPSAHEAAVSDIERESLRVRLSPSAFARGRWLNLRKKRKAAKCGLLYLLEGIYSAATA